MASSSSSSSQTRCKNKTKQKSPRKTSGLIIWVSINLVRETNYLHTVTAQSSNFSWLAYLLWQDALSVPDGRLGNSMKPGNKEWTGFRFFSFSGSQTRLGSPGTDELRRGCELRAPKETRRARVGSDKPPNSKRHGRALARGITINPLGSRRRL